MDLGAKASRPERSERVCCVHEVQGGADRRAEASQQPLLCVGSQVPPARLAHLTFPVTNSVTRCWNAATRTCRRASVGRKYRTSAIVSAWNGSSGGRGRVGDQQLYIWAPANYALGGREFLRIDGDAEHRSCRATEHRQVGQVHLPAAEVEDGAAVGYTSSGCQEVVRKKEAWTNRRATK